MMIMVEMETVMMAKMICHQVKTLQLLLTQSQITTIMKEIVFTFAIIPARLGPVGRPCISKI
jgi:hypothetical protein